MEQGKKRKILSLRHDAGLYAAALYFLFIQRTRKEFLPPPFFAASRRLLDAAPQRKVIPRSRRSVF